MTAVATVATRGEAQTYEVHAGPALLADWVETAQLDPAPDRTLIVTQSPIAEHWAEPVLAAATAAGHNATLIEIDDGEPAKSVATLELLWQHAATLGLGRGDVIVGLGGGVVTDIAGFAAATWMRGIRVVQLPTTVLGQVDAAIGGKTGINTSAGKNLAGAFWQPASVIADTDTLTTLPIDIAREGFGEVIKTCLLISDDAWQTLASLGDDPASRLDDAVDLLRRCMAHKAAVVSDDTREQGRRAHLNLGHTYGHALEAATDYTAFRHGEAVGLGLLVAETLSRQLDGLPDLEPDELHRALTRLRLPTVAPALDRERIWQHLRADKKATSDVRWVVLDHVGAPRLTQPGEVTDEMVDAAIDSIEQDTTEPAPTEANA